MTKSTGLSRPIGLVAHTDTVHPIIDKLSIIQYDNILFGYGYDTVLDVKKYGVQGCGGDDKVGIYICLQALKDLPDVKCVFYRQEETGCKGSGESDVKYFNNCRFVIQCDRKGNADFITKTNGYIISGDDFIEDATPLMEKYGYKVAQGTSTDVGKLAQMGLGLSACNLSCGFYEPHYKDTYVDIGDVQNCYNLITDMYYKMDKIYSHEAKSAYVAAAKSSTYRYDNEYDYEWSGAYSSENRLTVQEAKYRQYELVPGWKIVDKELDFELFDPAGLSWLRAKGFKYPVDNEFKIILHGSDIKFTAQEYQEYLTKFNKAFSMPFLNVEEEDVHPWLINEDGSEEPYVLQMGVFSRYHNAWLDSESAEWYDDFGTYILK